MRKIFILLIFLLVGCGEETIVSDFSYSTSLYRIASPYKAAISNYSKSSYDTLTVDTMLSKISNNYFDVSTSFYEEGQYLDDLKIKQMFEELNCDDLVAIYEQNYLNSALKLKGISIGLVVSIIPDNYIDIINYVVDYMTNITSEKVIIGIYLESTNFLPGNYIYVYDGKINESNYNYQVMDSTYLMNNDLDNYQNFISVKNAISDNSIYVSGVGLYQDIFLQSVNITISSSYMKQSELIYISEEISSLIVMFDCVVNVSFKSGNEVIGIVKKEGNFINLEILGGF